MVLEWTMATQSPTPATAMWDTVTQCQYSSYLEAGFRIRIPIRIRIRINLSCWIRIRIRMQIADPDPDPGGQK